MNYYEICGQISVPNGLVDVSDPCYDRGTWCAAYNIPVIPGEYVCVLKKVDAGDWGVRVERCAIFHERYRSKFSSLGATEHLSAYDIGVDAGLAGFFVSPKKEYNDEEWSAFCDMISNRDHIVKEGLFVTSSGYGDGGYDLYATRNKDGQIVALEIVFIPGEENEEEE